MSAKSSTFVGVSFCLVSGCIGPSIEPGIAPLESAQIFDLTSEIGDQIVAHSFQAGNSNISVKIGSVDRLNNRITIEGISGDWSLDRQSALMEEGSLYTFLVGVTKYAAEFVVVPSIGNPQFGVFGIPTHFSLIPKSGTAAFSGSSSIQIIDGPTVYDLNGTSTAVANFDTQSINITLEGLSGKRIDGATVPVDVQNVASIQIEGSTISGGNFRDGNVQMTSDQLSGSLSGQHTSQVSGSFFGPDAGEIGGILLVDDTVVSGTLLIQGSYLAD